MPQSQGNGDIIEDRPIELIVQNMGWKHHATLNRPDKKTLRSSAPPRPLRLIFSSYPVDKYERTFAGASAPPFGLPSASYVTPFHCADGRYPISFAEQLDHLFDIGGRQVAGKILADVGGGGAFSGFLEFRVIGELDDFFCSFVRTENSDLVR